MSDIGFKPRGADGPLYNPERDYAYITPTLMRQAVENLDDVDNVVIAWWRSKFDVSGEEIVRLVDAVAKAQRDFVNANDPVNSFEQALQRHGFYDFREPVRCLFFYSVGEVFCAAWFKAVREVSVVGEESPAQLDMARFTAAVREFSQRKGRPLYQHDHLAEVMQMRNDVLQTRINLLGQELQTLKETLRKQQEAQRQQPKPKKRGFLAWLGEKTDYTGPK